MTLYEAVQKPYGSRTEAVQRPRVLGIRSCE